MGPGPRFELESGDPQSPRITRLPYPGHGIDGDYIAIDKGFLTGKEGQMILARTKELDGTKALICG